MGNRVIILGNGGTGKSTLAAELGRTLNYPVTHLDQLSMRSGWVHVPETEFRDKLTAVLRGDRWIVDGWSFHSTIRMRLEACDTVIYLAYPIWFAYWNALKRHIRYAFKQNPYDPPNSAIWKKTRKMVRAMWWVYTKYEPELRTILPEYADKKEILQFQSRKELRRWLKEEVYAR
jgi:adenylate kinase family enzyme